MTARGRSLEELFGNAMTGLYAVLGPKFAREGAAADLELDCADSADLLVDFLNELLSRMDLDGEAFRVVSFRRLDGEGLAASLKGKKITGFERRIKSAACRSLSRQNGLFKASLILDCAEAD